MRKTDAKIAGANHQSGSHRLYPPVRDGFRSEAVAATGQRLIPSDLKVSATYDYLSESEYLSARSA